MLQPPHPMADGMEERDYFLGKVTEATPAQQEWVETYGVDDPAAAGAPAAKHRTAPGAGVTRGRESTDEQCSRHRWRRPLLDPRPARRPGSLGLIFAKKAVHAALGMALTMIILGIFYIAQDAHFLGVIQVFVYTGAVMMLFLFVLMLVGVDSSDGLLETLRVGVWRPRSRPGTGGLLTAALGSVTYPEPAGVKSINEETGNVSAMAELDLRSLRLGLRGHPALLITAALGAHGPGPSRATGQGPQPARLEQASGAARQYVAGLPAPGVYARHNAVDTPALLPDGTPTPLSVSRVLTARDQVTTPGAAAVEAEGPNRRPDRGGLVTMSLVKLPIYLATILFCIGEPRC